MKKIVALIVALCAMLLVSCSCAKEPREVRTAKINEKGELVIIFTDGTESIVGRVTGEDGADGVDGKDGIDGKDGVNGKDGAQGPAGEKGSTGLMGPEGKNGRSIKSVAMGSGGNLVVTYDDDTTSEVELLGELYLFGGRCGDNAAWALYNGGILVIGGEGITYDYSTTDTPWSSIVSLIAAVYIDTSDGLTIGNGLLAGIDESIVSYYEETTTMWVDMTDGAPIYATADNTAEAIATLGLGETLAVVSVDAANGFTKIVYNGSYAYIETKYTVSQNGSVVYDAVDYQLTVTNGDGANLRSFPDATAASKDNIKANAAQGAILNCTGVSQNGRWYRVTYNGMTLYVLASLVAKQT